MGFLDSLHRANIVNDPASQFDRTNIGSGILQARAAITQALAQDNPFLDSQEFPAIALWVSEPSLVTSMNDASSPVLAPAEGTLERFFTYTPTMQIKIYFRVPILHSNIPLPSKFSSEAKNSLSKLNPEDRDALLISCHPFLYADFEEFSGINAGDQIEIRFDDKSYSSAKIIKSEKKGPNNIGSDNNLAAGFAGISNFVSSIIDLFDDEAEVAILGHTFDPSTPDEVYELSVSYDEDNTIPGKDQHSRKGMNNAHTEMIPYIKAFIYKVWVDLKVEIQINSVYRTPEEQKRLLDKYNDITYPAYQENLKAWEANTSAEKGPEPKKPAGKPGSRSWHLVGGALDFNPKKDGKVFLKKKHDIGEWRESGIPQIGESLGLQWGGDFSGNYDPIHFDLGKIHTVKQMQALLKEAEKTSAPPNRAEFV